MPRTQYDLSNIAIRIFLQEIGNFYDKERGLEVFTPTSKQKDEIHSFFHDECAYCGTSLNNDATTLDHLIPLNRTALGLHAWGNVVSCCSPCNREKHSKAWGKFLEIKAGPLASQRSGKICEFIERYRYKPELGLQSIARNLYDDVGAVSSTLIRLRLKQAEESIRAALKSQL